MIDDIDDALERCFISPNVSDSNLEAANIVDTTDRIARNLYRIANAITPQDALPVKMPGGRQIGSLTEVVLYAAENFGLIAEALAALAESSARRDTWQK